MFKSKIIEFSIIKAIQATEYGLFIYDDYDLLLLKENRLSVVRNMKTDTDFTFEDKGLWIKSGGEISRFIDYHEKGYKYKNLPLPINSDWQFFDDYLIGVDYRDNHEGLCVVDRKSGKIKKKNEDFYSAFTFISEKLVLRTFDGHLICYDMSFEEIWRIKIEKECFTNIVKEPQGYKDMVIVNYGESGQIPEGDFELNAYSIEDGRLKWQVILPSSPYSSNLAGDKIYISVKDRIMVLEPETGEILIDISHGFQDEEWHSVYPFEDHLIVASMSDAKVHIFNLDGELVQKITLPEPYTVLSYWLPDEYNGRLFQVIENKDMNLRGASDGLLILKPDKKQTGRIQPQLPTRPDFKIKVIENKSGENEHKITTSHSDLDAVILYSVITLKKIALELDSPLDPGTREANHSGVLRLEIDSRPLPGVKAEQLKLISEKVEHYANEMGMTAGDKGNAYKVIIELI